MKGLGKLKRRSQALSKWKDAGVRSKAEIEAFKTGFNIGWKREKIGSEDVNQVIKRIERLNPSFQLLVGRHVLTGPTMIELIRYRTPLGLLLLEIHLKGDERYTHFMDKKRGEKKP